MSCTVRAGEVHDRYRNSGIAVPSRVRACEGLTFSRILPKVVPSRVRACDRLRNSPHTANRPKTGAAE